MPEVEIVFEGDWNGVLAPARRRVVRRVPLRASLKDVIEAAGVPHTEIGRIEVGGEGTAPAPEVGPPRIRRSASEIRGAAAEIRASAPASPIALRRAAVTDLVVTDLSIRVRPVPQMAGAPIDPDPRFVLDVHLGALAARLRLLGFDALYRVDAKDEELARSALVDSRWLLTRDRGLLKHRSLAKGCLIRADRPEMQANELLDRLGIRSLARPWARCLRCNGALYPVAKRQVLERLQPLTRRFHDDFRRCDSCGRVYWDGTHCRRLREMLREMGVPADTTARPQSDLPPTGLEGNIGNA